MKYRMLVTTFYRDILQFRMFCVTLAKNWQGTKDLIVCIGWGENLSVYEKIVQSAFDDSWKVEVKPSLVTYPNGGYTEMQVNTVYYSVHCGAKNVVVWDCKDFVLKPCDETIFFDNERHRLPYVYSKRMIDFCNEMGYKGLIDFLDVPLGNLPAINNIRPWLWNRETLERYWNHVLKKFGHFSTWKPDELPPLHFPGCCEIYGYFVYACHDPLKTFKFSNSTKENYLLYSGAYSTMTFENLANEVIDFELPEKKVWKHSRRHAHDKRFLEVTKSVLLRYGIDEEQIKLIYNI